MRSGAFMKRAIPVIVIEDVSVSRLRLTGRHKSSAAFTSMMTGYSARRAVLFA